MQPVNPNASPEARNLLDRLYHLKGRYLLSAQHDYISSGTKYGSLVAESTSKAPAIWGSDFSFHVTEEKGGKTKHHGCGPMNMVEPSEPGEDWGFVDCDPHRMRLELLERVKQQFQKGHIITLMWHCPFPDKGETCCIEDVWAMDSITDERWEELLNPESKLHQQWKDQVDLIAGYLKQLQQWRIPILWRPYHEMNGVWFWWGNKKGPDGFQKLWIALWERFVNHHKLDNLLWVWNANAPRERAGDDAYEYADFYPGSDYVDILAADVYRKDYKQSHHDELLDLANGKPIALGEVGQLPPAEIIEQQPQWLWAMPWGCLTFNENVNTDQDRKRFYGNPRVLSLADICDQTDA